MSNYKIVLLKLFKLLYSNQIDKIFDKAYIIIKKKGDLISK